MSDSRSCGRCIYYNSIINECGEESKCMRDVDEAKYTSYIAGKKQGKLDGAREFAEWLCKGVVPQNNPHIIYGVREILNDGSSYEVEAEDLLTEWQKGKENE